MAQKEIEVILTRQLADCLAMPVFLVDKNGNLLFYNEPAEIILGRRFEETGELPASEWSTVFTPTDENGLPILPSELPLMIALSEHRPSHRVLRIRGLDSVPHLIEVTALPLIGQGARHLGAVAIFWEVSQK
jgi:PAS domain-containing protein